MLSQNKSFGFFGTIANAEIGIEPQAAWDMAIDALRDRGATPWQARDFLDSAYGRHVADCLIDCFPDFNINDAFKACFGSEARLALTLNKFAY
jgi:hypothetical protein